MDLFNSYDPNLQFTIEAEKENSIAFLDLVLIRKPNGSIITNWYTKPTASGRIINFMSDHPLQQKISTVNSFIHRIVNLSHPTFHEENFAKLKDILRNNNYPSRLVNHCINYFSKQKIVIRNNSTDSLIDSRRTYFKIPYIPVLSQKIKKILHTNECNIVFYNIKKLNSLFTQLKDVIPKKYQSNLIYHIDCKDCNACYVGQTKQFLMNRVNQHKYDCKKLDSNKLDNTALMNHVIDYNHSFNFDLDAVKILDKESHFFKKNLSEMIFIKKNTNCVNLRTDTNNLNKIYSFLIERM